MNTSIPIERTRKKIPCLWERGGMNGKNVKSSAQIIAGPSGDMKKAIFVKKEGDRSCKDHALIPVQIGDFVLQAGRLREGEEMTIDILRITKINMENAETQTVAVFANDAWNPASPPTFLNASLAALTNKMNDHHCRTVYYAIEPETTKPGYSQMKTARDYCPQCGVTEGYNPDLVKCSACGFNPKVKTTTRETT